MTRVRGAAVRNGRGSWGSRADMVVDPAFPPARLARPERVVVVARCLHSVTRGKINRQSRNLARASA